jgi:hypothetical protein
MVIKIAIEFVTFDYIVDKSAARKKLFLPHFYNLVKLLQPHPCPTPCSRRPCAGLGKPMVGMFVFVFVVVCQD